MTRLPIIAICGLPLFVLTACIDYKNSETPGQTEFYLKVVTSMAACRRSVCETKFWDNEDCAEAFNLIYGERSREFLTPEIRTAEEHLERMTAFGNHLDYSYRISLEQEVGATIFSVRQDCRDKLDYRFDAFDKEIFKNRK